MKKHVCLNEMLSQFHFLDFQFLCKQEDYYYLFLDKVQSYRLHPPVILKIKFYGAYVTDICAEQINQPRLSYSDNTRFDNLYNNNQEEFTTSFCTAGVHKSDYSVRTLFNLCEPSRFIKLISFFGRSDRHDVPLINTYNLERLSFSDINSSPGCVVHQILDKRAELSLFHENNIILI